jgi:hypothetical protein
LFKRVYSQFFQCLGAVQMAISLTQFAKDIKQPKTSVWAKCKELDIYTANGLDGEAIARLKKAFAITDQPTPDQPQSPFASGAMVLSSGRALPSVPGQFVAPQVAVDLSDLHNVEQAGASLANASAEQIGNFLTQYAHLRLQQSIVRIDAQFQALEGQALNQSVGKLSQPADGESAA